MSHWQPNYLDPFEDGGEEHTGRVREPRCSRCGSTDVRWRPNGGKWVLFSSEPGKLHVCDLSDDDFKVVK